MVEVRPLGLDEVVEILPTKHEDERGFFSEVYNREALAAVGIDLSFVQDNHALAIEMGVLRGLHYQADPHQEVKFIRCTQGRIFDVIVDLRPDSPTFLQWDGYELSAENGRMLYVPEHFATGFLTLEAHCAMYYPTTAFYAPDAACGIRYNDPAVGIDWPGEINEISDTL